MMTLLRHLSESQWIMLMTFAVIGTLLMVATDAKAMQYAAPHPNATTISHCGWIQADNRIYNRSSRNTRIIQRHLQDLGYSVGHTGSDGRYGKYSRRAVAQFQRDHNLKVDGVVGTNTATHLAYAAHPTANVRRCKRPFAGRMH